MKFVHLLGLFLTVLALAWPTLGYSQSRCEKLFTKASSLSLVWNLSRSNSREQQNQHIKEYGRKKLILSDVVVKKPEGFLNSSQVSVLTLNQTNLETLRFAATIEKPLIWVVPQKVLDGKIISTKHRLLGGRLLYNSLIRPRLQEMGARSLKAISTSESKFSSQRDMRIEIKSAIYHAYHHHFKTPHSTKQDYIDYRENREFLTKTELVTYESFELLKQYPLVFSKLISHYGFNVHTLEVVLMLPRPYLKLIEEHLNTGYNFVFMNSNQQPVTLGTMNLFLKVLSILSDQQVVYYNGRYDSEAKELEITESKSL
ncbi:MAG: hypothetical protein MK008_00245 [Bdellovibrionales bacterium]|nr:hypothetical protein [Bdellovibrionales bacterium]